jgi:hypothetical protein
MALKKSIYSALEDVVGTENITEEPGTLLSYAWRTRMLPNLEKFETPVEAVVLPKDVREIQAVVRICKQFNLQIRVISSGWSISNAMGADNAIEMDLRRMNHIIEINEKNMYAVVEPFVIGAQLQAELMKRGLTCNMNGTGSHVAAMHFASGLGHGFTSQTHGFADRNVLGVEWVSPEGNIVRFGSWLVLWRWSRSVFKKFDPQSLGYFYQGCYKSLSLAGSPGHAYHWHITKLCTCRGPSKFPPSFLYFQNYRGYGRSYSQT